jgi:hypothetical protein
MDLNPLTVVSTTLEMLLTADLVVLVSSDVTCWWCKRGGERGSGRGCV